MAIKTKQELKQMLTEKYIKQAVDEVALIIEQEWKKLMQDLFYDTYSPEFYSRTFQMIDSIMKLEPVKTNNGYTIHIKMDELTYHTPYEHYSINEVWNFTEMGFRGISGGQPIVVGGHVYENILDYVNNNLIKLFKSKLMELGLNVK